MTRRKGIIAFIIFTLSSLSYASGYQSGSIVDLMVHHPGNTDSYYIVKLNGTRTESAPSACNTFTDTWVGDLSIEAGKAQYATLLAAFMANKTIRIESNNACLIGRELARNVRLFAD